MESLSIYNKVQLGEIGITNLVFEIFKGISYEDISFKNFDFPLVWFMVNFFIVFIVGSYMYDDLKNNGVYILSRIGNPQYFWISKVLWIIINNLIYYLIVLGIAVIAGKRFSGSSLEKDLIETLGTLFILYFTTSVALCLLNTTLSLIVKPVYAYLIIILLLDFSIFLKNNLLPGQHSLILRHVPFDKIYNLTLWKSLIYNFVLSTTSIILC